ncbi:MAG: hypothetical protein J7K85_07925 [Anaerolineaceae bacterium]|nr:hypothetical protein [Anaerolineaceae bacterium]
MGHVIGRGRIFLGIEDLQCPRCGGVNHVKIHSDLPERDYLSCTFCGYRAMLNFAPIMDKYGVPRGASKAEKREITQYLRSEVGKI